MKKLTQCIFITYLLIFYPFDQIISSPKSAQETRAYKKYTLVVFMAADNNLHPYAWNNIKQMEAISSPYLNIVVQINFPGDKNITHRYVIENGQKNLVTTPGQAPTKKLDSGNPQTLIDCVNWAMTYYPAEHLILNLWNHGSGIYDPAVCRAENAHITDIDNTNDIFTEEKYNRYNTYEKSSQGSLNRRGICFDDTYKSYMNNQDVEFALHEIHNKILRGKKIAVIWLEACLMSMIEVTNIFKHHANYLVSSENVEYAPGSNYQLVLNFFTQAGLLYPKDFACHIVNSFKKMYESTNLSFTQSAVDLSRVNFIEENINLVSQQLLIALSDQKNKSVIKLLQKCKSRNLCTCFHEPTFIDLRHFYLNLQANIGQISLNDTTREHGVKSQLLNLINTGVYLINNAVIANTTGNSLKNACGISIYFPENGIFNSYLKCNFAQSNNWSKMLIQYILQSR